VFNYELVFTYIFTTLWITVNTNDVRANRIKRLVIAICAILRTVDKILNLFVLVFTVQEKGFLILNQFGFVVYFINGQLDN
jgi:hypothetical protein